MLIANIRFAPWDQLYYLILASDQSFSAGEQLVVKTSSGTDLGRVEDVYESNLENQKENEVTTFLRQASREDIAVLAEKNSQNKECLKFCRNLIKKHKLEMKLVDTHLSFDGNKITYAFIADGRVDFRELVKELVKKYNKSIRLQQLGVRDEVKFFGDVGPCGRVLCCQGHLEELGNVTADYAKDQQVANRGAERLSGPCGRLKCCLAYEETVYKELNKKFPPLGSRFKTKEGEGVVVGYHTLRGIIDVNVGKDDERKIIEVKL